MRGFITTAAIFVAVALAGPASASANVESWRMCNGTPFVRVHNITCAYGRKVALNGFRPRTLSTWIGGFHCMRERNAENVIWLYTCNRNRGHDGVFFPDVSANLASASVSAPPIHTCAEDNEYRVPASGYTSCPFAFNIASAWASTTHFGHSSRGSLRVYSPVTHKRYAVRCAETQHRYYGDVSCVMLPQGSKSWIRFSTNG